MLACSRTARFCLSHGELAITDSLTIDAFAVPGLTIDAGDGADQTFGTGDGFRIFKIDDGVTGPTIDVSISGLTLTGGDISGLGGAILSSENFAVASCTISNNFSTYGGGIYSLGTLTVIASTISNNSAVYDGGGISNFFTLTVTASTISDNFAGYGGGIWSYNTSDLVTTRSQIVNTTISTNQASNAGGGIFNFNGLMVIQFSTITDNQAPVDYGSGVASYGGADSRNEVYSSIIAGNLGNDVDVVNGGSNTFDSSGFNLIGTGNATGAFGATGDQVIGSDDPELGPLADNGGPTWTHALLPRSRAIDTGNRFDVPGVGNVPLYDQRGNPFTRKFDGDGSGNAKLDVGAYELQHFGGPMTYVVDTPVDETDGDYSPGRSLAPRSDRSGQRQRRVLPTRFL